MKPRITIFHASIFEGDALTGLREKLSQLGEVSYFSCLVESPQHLEELAPDTEILISNGFPLTADNIQGLPKLRMISLLGSGYDTIDLAAAQEAGITVCNAPRYGTENVAQHTVALLFELAHRIGQQNHQIKTQGWKEARPDCIQQFPITELSGKTIGFVGFGAIASRVMAMLSGFGMHPLCTSSRPTSELQSLGVKKVEIEELFASADIVSIHARATQANNGLVSRELLQSMKPSSFLINTARGELIDEAALADALSHNQIAGAAIDVLETEPPTQDNPLVALENCILTPHIAWNSMPARARLAHESYENVRSFLDGAIQNKVN